MINNKSKNISQTFILFIVLFVFLVPFFLTSMPDMDEIWNYQFARRILYGQIPYKDFFMLPAPLSAQLNALFLSIFPDELMTLRWLGSFFALINGLIAYYIFRLLGKNRIQASIFTCIFILIIDFYPYNNYSWLAVLFLTLAFLLEIIILSNKKTNMLWELCLGITLGLATASKQNIGLLALIISIIFLLIKSKLQRSKNQEINSHWKDNLEIITFRVLGWLIVIGFEIIFLIVNDVSLIGIFKDQIISMNQFKAYCSQSYVSLFSDNIIIKLLAVLVPGFIITPIIKAVFSENPLILLLSGFYAIVNFSMVYPIADAIHLVFAMPLSIIAVGASFDSGVSSENNNRNDCLVIILLLVSLIIGSTLIIDKNNRNADNTINHYKGIPFTQERIQAINDIDKFIVEQEQSGKSVYFLNYQATLYLIPLDEFCFKYDTMLLGNFGANGEAEIISKLDSMRNIIVLIRGENMRANCLETKNLEAYVKHNLKLINSIYGFDVYSH